MYGVGFLKNSRTSGEQSKFKMCCHSMSEDEYLKW
jgi:hypothetical protein